MLPAFVTISEGFWDSEKKHMACIPQKINGWNLTRHPWKRKIFYKKPSFSGSMKLVGGWTNPSEKYAGQIGNLPQIGHLGVKIKNYLSCHHRSLKLVVSTTQLNKATYKNPMWPDHLGWTRDFQKMMGPMGRVADFREVSSNPYVTFKKTPGFAWRPIRFLRWKLLPLSSEVVLDWIVFTFEKKTSFEVSPF